MTIRTYSELIRTSDFNERYRYLALRGVVGEPTFGFERYINQKFYQSRQWRQVRRDVMVRDEGCDLGVAGYEVHERIIIHHMNPMVANDIVQGLDDILNPEYLICVSHQTHNAIHYGDERQLPREYVDRQVGDTSLWTRR